MNSTDTHTLVAQEIAAQVARHTERRRAIVAERAALCSEAMRNGGFADSTPVVDEDERAARAIAKNILNGHAPAFLSLPPPITRDRELAREQAGLEIVIRILSDKQLIVRAAAAVEWSETHSAEWKSLCREIVLTTVKREALENRARALLSRCPDLHAISTSAFPLTGLIERGGYEVDVDELRDAAVKAGVVTPSEIRKAQQP
jgi:hypothetical protein